MKQVEKMNRRWFALVTAIVMLFALAAATLAWYTQNQLVDTNSVTGRSAEENLELQISSSGGSQFKPADEASISQVNKYDKQVLMPVSTSDLETFVTNRNTDAGVAKKFIKVDNEEFIYHGRVYIRARTKGSDMGSKMSLYLDENMKSGGAIVKSASGKLLNASRIGLSIGNNAPVIFYLNKDQNNENSGLSNTEIGGESLKAGQVLTYSEGAVKAVKDPSRDLSQFTISQNSAGIKVPDKPLADINVNQIYPVDIYFYLEGCDPDCVDEISYKESDLHLAFFGVMNN